MLVAAGDSFLTDTQLRHRRRARCEDRIRTAKDTGLTNLPLYDFDANRIWIEIVCLVCELIAWMQMLALHDHTACRWEPKRAWLRLFSAAARLTRHARRTRRARGRQEPRGCAQFGRARCPTLAARR